MSDQTAAAPTPQRQMPLFYHDPKPVVPERHAGKSLKPNPTFAFAARTNVAPINVMEFAVTQRQYPIVFATAPHPFPLAVVGLRKDENLFVDADGRWREGWYVPAYIRRYPFVFIEAPDGKFILAVDEGGGFLVDNGPLPLFDAERKPTQIVQGALQFCGAYQQHHKLTMEFAQALVAHDLLEENRANAQIGGDEKIALSGFKIVNEAKFNALPESLLGEWRQKGWLGLVYAHLFSLHSWQALAQVAHAKRRAGG